MKFDRMVVIPKEMYDQMKADTVESTDSKVSNPKIEREPTRERDVLITQQQPGLPAEVQANVAAPQAPLNISPDGARANVTSEDNRLPSTSTTSASAPPPPLSKDSLPAPLRPTVATPPRRSSNASTAPTTKMMMYFIQRYKHRLPVQ